MNKRCPFDSSNCFEYLDINIIIVHKYINTDDFIQNRRKRFHFEKRIRCGFHQDIEISGKKENMFEKFLHILSFRLRSPRSNSPQRASQASRPHSRNVSPSFADSTFSAVHAALNKRHVQVNGSPFFVIFSLSPIE